MPRKIPDDDIDLDDIQNLEAFAKRYPDLVKLSQLRWQIFKREENGLAKSGAIVKKEGRWRVVIPRYKDWLLHDDAG